MILLDTSILSRALRRRGSRDDVHARSLRTLVESDRPVAIPGIVAQEILSGIRSTTVAQAVSSAIDGFPILLATMRAHREAARIYSACRAEGIAASHIDCLIAAQAMLANAALFTSDTDFERIAEITGLRRYRPST